MVPSSRGPLYCIVYQPRPVTTYSTTTTPTTARTMKQLNPRSAQPARTGATPVSAAYQVSMRLSAVDGVTVVQTGGGDVH